MALHNICWCMCCCLVASQQQQLDDWCSRQLPASTAVADAEPSPVGTAGDEHRTVSGLLAAHDQSSAEV